MNKHQWNNPMEARSGSIFKLLREGSTQSKNKLGFTLGTKYAIADEGLALVHDNNTHKTFVPTEEGLATGMYSSHSLISSGDVLTCTSVSEKTIQFTVGEGAEAIKFSVPTDSDILKSFVEKAGFIGEKAKKAGVAAGGSYKDDLITGKEDGGEDLSGEKLIGPHGDGDLNADTATKGKDPLSDDAVKGKGSVGKLDPDLISGSKEAGKDISAEELEGDHGDKKVSPEIGSLHGDAITNKNESASEEEVEADDDKEKEKKDKEDAKEDKLKKDADRREDDATKEKKDAEEKEVEKDDDKEEKKCPKCGKVDCKCDKDVKESVDDKGKKSNKDDSGKKDSPESDKENVSSEENPDDNTSEKDTEEVDEATSRLLQNIGSAVVRALIDEMAKSGSKGLSKNESFIMEVAKRVARIEREGIHSVQPKTLESKLIYPSTQESLNFVDIAVLETNEGTFVIDRFHKDDVYLVDPSLTESILKEGVTAHMKSMTKVDITPVFTVEGKQLKFM